MYFWIKLKNEFCSKSMVLYILFSILFISLIGIFQKKLEFPSNFNIKIIDLDQTKLSKEIVKNIAGLDSVILAKNKVDVEYIIKKDFEKKFVKGDFNALIEVNRKNLKSGVNILNDKIASIIIDNYIYFDIYEKIKNEKNISFDEYNNDLAKFKAENEILSISLNDVKIYNNFSDNINYMDYVILFFLMLIGMNMGVNQFIVLSKIRSAGILDRLILGDLKEKKLVFLEMILAILKFFCIIIFCAIMIRVDVKIYFIAFILFLLNLILNSILEKILKKGMLILTLRVGVILFLMMGLWLRFYL